MSEEILESPTARFQGEERIIVGRLYIFIMNATLTLAKATNKVATRMTTNRALRHGNHESVGYEHG